MNTRDRVFLFFWFYIGWFGCVFAARYNWSFVSLIFPIVAWGYSRHQKIVIGKRLYLLLACALIGYFSDALFLFQNVISFPNSRSALPPVWLLSMWLLFASVLPMMALVFANRLPWAVVLGGVFGPLSYYAGISFDIFKFTSIFSLPIYVVFWGISFPIMILMQRKFK